jgi:hypothetical protein
MRPGGKPTHTSRKPRLVDGQSILHLDVPTRPTEALAANAVGPRGRWDDEHVDRRDAVGMITMEVFQPCDGGRLLFAMYVATVVWRTSIPSLSSSPRIYDVA